jgi:hypothetical protein
MASHFRGPLVGDRKSWGGAAENLGLEAISGETDLITVFDDFDGVVKGTDSFSGAAIFEPSGWVLTDLGATAPTGDTIDMNNPAQLGTWAPSCLEVWPGTDDDEGGSMQLDLLNGAVGATLATTHPFPHMWFPEDQGPDSKLDSTTFIFACRLGFTSGAIDGDWDNKVFVGLATAGDTGVITPTTGVITIPAGGPMFGFHIPEDGLRPAGSVDDPAVTLADGTSSGATWWDLAIRLDIADWSDDDNNGTATFYSAPVPRVSGIPGGRSKHQPGEAGGAWVKHDTVLENQIPFHTVSQCPHIEHINGPTAGQDGTLDIDWWAFGHSRFSR